MSSAAPATDRQCMILLTADRELATVEIIAAHAGLSDRALERIGMAINAIRSALDLQRRELGLQPRRQQVAA
jgi:hypothetical protein